MTAGPDAGRRTVLSRRVRLLVTATISYNVIEAIVAISAGVAVREGQQAWRGGSCCRVVHGC